MKKRKIIIYSIVLLLLLSCIGLGTFSLLMGEKFTNNNIVFEVNDEEAYCQISGEYFYNNVVDADKAYTPKM